MTSRLQQPRNADEQSARRFVGFPFRLQPNPQPGGQRHVRRLNREVMSQGDERGLDGVEPGMRGVGFVRHGRRSVVRCELSFDDEARNDTQEVPGTVARSCVTQITGGA